MHWALPVASLEDEDLEPPAADQCGVDLGAQSFLLGVVQGSMSRRCEKKLVLLHFFLSSPFSQPTPQTT